MSKKVTLCNSEGKSLCGSDGHIQVDGRFNLLSTRFSVSDYRERFRKHFAWKAEYWTHFYFDNQPGSCTQSTDQPILLPPQKFLENSYVSDEAYS